ncbi:hypothetical protein KUCAC02_017698, partial [Chaenocephalus aceratus]
FPAGLSSPPLKELFGCSNSLRPNYLITEGFRGQAPGKRLPSSIKGHSSFSITPITMERGW